MKKFISLVLSLTMILSLFAGVNLTAYAETLSGTCGVNAVWSLNTDTGELVISGTGKMEDYDYNSPNSHYTPWHSKWSYIKNVTIDSGVTSIGNYSFYGCAALESIKFPGSELSIGERAFEGCTSLTNVTIPDSVTSVGEYSFLNCTKLTSVTISDKSNISYFFDTSDPIGSPFSGCPIKKIIIANGSKKISEAMIVSRSDLTEVIIPDSVTAIDGYAFENCTALSNITIPDSVTTIGKYAFENCTVLTNITIPNGVTTIGTYAFYDCINLTTVTISDSITDRGYNWECPIRKIIIADGSKQITRQMIVNPYYLQEVVIPDSVTYIANSAFYNCSKMTSITIPASVTRIEYNAFESCDNLVINGEKGSYAETFANENGIPFKCLHQWDSGIVTRPESCSEEGEKTYTCAKCGEKRTETIAKLAHKATVKGKKQATYFAKGYTGNIVCTVCNTLIVKGNATAKRALKAPRTTVKSGRKKLTVTINKISGATGYQIRYKTGTDRYTVKIYTSKKSIRKTFKKLKSNKRYRVQARAMIKSGKRKAYSAWSKNITVKTK